MVDRSSSTALTARFPAYGSFWVFFDSNLGSYFMFLNPSSGRSRQCEQKARVNTPTSPALAKGTVTQAAQS